MTSSMPTWPAKPVITLALISLLGACDFSSATHQIDPALARRLETAKNASAQAAGVEKLRALLTLGNLQLEAGKLFEAAQSFQQAHEINPKDTEVLGGRAKVYVRLGYINSAIQSIRTCFELSKAVPDCWYAYGRLLETNPSQDAEREAHRVWTHFVQFASKDHPHRAYATSTLAQLNAKFGEYKVPQPKPDPKPVAKAEKQNTVTPQTPTDETAGASAVKTDAPAAKSSTDQNSEPPAPAPLPAVRLANTSTIATQTSTIASANANMPIEAAATLTSSTSTVTYTKPSQLPAVPAVATKPKPVHTQPAASNPHAGLDMANPHAGLDVPNPHAGLDMANPHAGLNMGDNSACWDGGHGQSTRWRHELKKPRQS